jgi:NAD(P)-dependent dehydrogenase (short-subunit alcohol dehydrogenase family)
MRLKDKVAVITGGASGIGRGTALLFAKEGAKVVVADVNRPMGEETVRVIKGGGGEAIFQEADISKSEEVQRLMRAAADAYRKIDILFNNAAIFILGTAESLREEDWDRVLGVNLKGVYLCSKYAIPHMRRAGGGVIINTASPHSYASLTQAAAYAASKGGVLALTRQMALDFAPDGIRVNCVIPGAIDTPMLRGSLQKPGEMDMWAKRHAIERIGQPEDVAKVALFLATDDAAFVTGSPVFADGGMMAKLL